jgi:hypothetical protein
MIEAQIHKYCLLWLMAQAKLPCVRKKLINNISNEMNEGFPNLCECAGEL